jgi:hypothetical protein
MPKSHVTKLIAGLHERLGIYGAVSADSKNGRALISAMVESFQVSRDAAEVRLKVLHLLGPEPALRSLFS